jgi:hypothetical protein
MARRSDLDRLTRRWRERHDARRPDADLRPRATGGREALAKRAFPFHEVTPAAYVAEHGAAMVGFTYDDESYADAELDAWLLEVGRLLREGREPKPATPTASAPGAAAAKPAKAAKPAPAKPAKAKPAKAPKPAPVKPAKAKPTRADG